MAFRVLTYNNISLPGVECLTRSGCEVASEFSSPDAILLRSHVLRPEQLPASVLCVARAGAGVNNIPVELCTRRGIPVFNTPGANANAVKELVAAALLLASRGVLEGIAFARSLHDLSDEAEFHRRLEAEKKRFRGSELHGKTLGVVGLGAIGARVAGMALTLGMDVMGYDPALSVDAAWRLPNQVRRADSLASLFAQCDYVSLHVPVLDSTRGMVNSALLAAARRGLCLLNFARREVVDIQALRAALDSGTVRRYVADFPVPELLGREDVILMPHLGASTQEAEDNCALMAAQQLRDYLHTGCIRNSVNFPSVELEHSAGCRLAVSNDNVPSILGSVLAGLAAQNLNVIDMLNKSRGEVAYNLIDVDQPPTAPTLAALRAIAGVKSVRALGHRAP